MFTVEGEQGVNIGGELAARNFHIVKGAALDEGFERFLIDIFVRDTGEEFGDVRKSAAIFARLNDRVAHARAEVLYTIESKPDIFLVDDGEIAVAFVHRRRQDFDTHAFTLRNDLRDFPHVARVGGEYGRHVVDGEIGLHVRGLVREVAVARRVRFVEAVRSKGLNLLPQFLHRLLLHTADDAALGEMFFLRVHFLGYFFAHCFAEFVRLEPAVSRDFYRELQDVVLVGNDTV